MKTATTGRKAETKTERELRIALARINRLEKALGTEAPSKGKPETSFMDFLKERAIRRKAQGKVSRREKGVLTGKQNRDFAAACRKAIEKRGLKGRVWVGGDANAWRQATYCVIDGMTYTEAAEIFVEEFDQKAAARAKKERQNAK